MAKAATSGSTRTIRVPAKCGCWMRWAEAKSDAAAASDATVAAKKTAAEEWAIAVNDSKSFGTWRYLLVTESEIKAASNWNALVAGR